MNGQSQRAPTRTTQPGSMALASRYEPARPAGDRRGDLGHVAGRHVRTSIFLVCILAALTMTGCKPGNYNVGLDLKARGSSPEEQAAAALVEADVDRKFKENQIAFDKASAQLELEKQTLPQIVAANNSAILMTTKADADARVAQANAAAQSARATGLSASVALLAIGLGFAISIPMLVIAAAVYMGILLVTAARQINARSRLAIVPAYINNVRIDYIIMQDEGGRWHVQNALEDERSPMRESKAISHLRPHLLQAAQVQWQNQQVEREQEGVVVKAWQMLFGRKRKPSVQIVPQPPSATQRTIDVEVDG
jgi:hypothetical protein